MCKFLMSLSLLCFCTFSYGELIDHLKKAEGKGDGHTMRNIDFIYMINLDRRPQKYALSKQYLEKYGVSPYRFSAVNGWELTIEAINDIGVKYQPGMTPLLATTYVERDGKKIPSHEFMSDSGKTYFVHCMSLGAMGCSLSHISILQDAYDSGYETIWVMEDDVEVLGDVRQLSDLIDELDAVVGANHWDVLFTDFDYRVGVGKYAPASGATKRPDMDCSPKERYSDKYTKKFQINDHFSKMAARFGTASMIIRRSGIIKLLEFSRNQNIYMPYDMENYLPPGIQRYCLTFDLVTNMLNSLSDIGAPDYLNTPQ
ncbi:MAG: glycosyltransferase family 25 protein [Parachlamydiaceae bacterium]